MKDFNKDTLEIATLRETKGKEQETLEKIDALLPKLINEQMWKEVAKMYWEYHLVWQHKTMTELAKPDNERDQKVLEEGSLQMMAFAKKAVEVIEEHRLEDMVGGAYRFLGRAYTFTGNHEKAKECYETAINSYSGKNIKSKLEVSGFLADSLIRLGMSKEGLALAQKTYADFNESELGKNLKAEDYFTWAVWMSGIAPRIVNALLDSGESFDKEQMKEWLQETEKELTNPSNAIKWGDSKFGFRLDEIRATLKRLENR